MWVVRHNDQPLPDDHANPNYRTVKVFVGLFVRPRSFDAPASTQSQCAFSCGTGPAAERWRHVRDDTHVLDLAALAVILTGSVSHFVQGRGAAYAPDPWRSVADAGQGSVPVERPEGQQRRGAAPDPHAQLHRAHPTLFLFYLPAIDLGWQSCGCVGSGGGASGGLRHRI